MAAFPPIDRYVVEAELGSGAFGAVYRARHLVLDRAVALKILHPQRASDSEVVQRFLREARAVAQVGSPNVVQVLDAGTTQDGRAYLAMELLEGEDLAHRLQRGRLPTHAVVKIGREILAALAVAHGRGVVHRDLKPANVFLARGPGGEEVAKVLDFGISKVRTESPADELTRTGTMLGTPHYMAPEQFKSSRDVDGRADLYALGVLLYEALAGKAPLSGASLHELIAVKLTEAPPPLARVAPDVPHAIGDAVMRALAIEPDARYPSAEAMDAALAAAQVTVSSPGVSLGPPRPSAGASVRPAPGPTSVAPRPAGRSRALPWIVGIASVLAAGAFLALAVTILGLFLARAELTEWSADAPPASPVPAPVLLPAPAPGPAPGPGPGPAPRSGAPTPGVHITPSTLGMVDEAGVAEVAERARPALAACRGSSAYAEQLQFTVAPGGRLMASGLRTSGATHDCVVSAIEAAGPVSTIMTGIARFDVSLDAR